MFCINCGTQLPNDSGFCHKCGTKIAPSEKVNSINIPNGLSQTVKKNKKLLIIAAGVIGLLIIINIVASNTGNDPPSPQREAVVSPQSQPSSLNNLGDGTTTSSALPDGFEWVDLPHLTSTVWEAPTFNDEILDEIWDEVWDEIRQYYIVGAIKNTSNNTISSVSINFIIFDSAGRQIGQALDTVLSFRGGNTWAFSAYVPLSEPASFDFAGLAIIN